MSDLAVVLIVLGSLVAYVAIARFVFVLIDRDVGDEEIVAAFWWIFGCGWVLQRIFRVLSVIPDGAARYIRARRQAARLPRAEVRK